MPRINLLPWREADRKRKRHEFVVAIMGAVGLALLFGLIFKLQMSSLIDHQNQRNQLLKTEIAELDKQIVEILDLETQKQRLLSRMEVIEQLQRSRPEVVHLFDQILKTLPEGVYLTAVVQSDRRIKVSGIAQSSTRVSAFMRNIDSSESIKDPSLEIIETKGKGDDGANFTLYVNQVTTKDGKGEDGNGSADKRKSSSSRNKSKGAAS